MKEKKCGKNPQAQQNGMTYSCNMILIDDKTLYGSLKMLHEIRESS